MKFFTNITLVVLFILSGTTIFAQKINAVKPALFASYPTSFACKTTELNEPFKVSKGQNVTVSFTGAPTFSGVVVNNTIRSKNLQYMAIRLPGLNNAIMALSKRIDENNNTIYIGHIINTKNSDAYELKHNKDGSYQFAKIDLEKLLPTCSQE